MWIYEGVLMNGFNLGVLLAALLTSGIVPITLACGPICQ